MTNRKATKRALICSLLAIVVCFSMLVGTTFAWFTDSVTSANNIIASGNLDVNMYYQVEGQTDWTALTDSSNIFMENALWEPGHTEVIKLKVVNEGSLALKYILGVSVDEEDEFTNVNGETVKLSDFIKYGIVDGAQTYTRDEAVLAVDATATALSEAYGSEEIKILPGEEKIVTLVVYMPTTVGNDANAAADEEPTINLALTVLATQVDNESDGFGSDYDAGLTPVEEGDVIVNTEDGLQLLYDADAPGEVYLYLVPEDYAESTVTVPEGVTAIGNYAFAYNANVEEVVLASTVSSLGRGFDSSAVKKVVLNEGLETIDSRAFRSTTALEEVVIPSTVTTIADNAFQKSAIKEIVIPATVETIGETAFGASKIEKVTFEGNTAIEGYAFRGCTELREVVMLGDDNQFVASSLNGRNAMWFCNGESNNPNTSNITFYVKNATVAARVKTAMGAEKDNIPVYIDGALFVQNSTQLLAGIKNASATEENVFALADGDYTGNIDITLANIGSQKGDLVFKALGDNAKITGTVTLGYRNQGVGATMFESNVTFEGVIFDHATDGNHSISVQDIKSLTLKDCTIIGDGEYGIESSRGNATGASLITGCTFENAAMQVLGNFGTGLVIENCIFNESRVNVQAGNGVTVQNCEFNATMTDDNIDDSFYMIRSNSTPITVASCEINIDSDIANVVTTAQAKWYLLANRGTANWTVSDVAVTLTAEAAAQTELKITACTSTGVINATNITVNGVLQ